MNAMIRSIAQAVQTVGLQTAPVRILNRTASTTRDNRVLVYIVTSKGAYRFVMNQRMRCDLATHQVSKGALKYCPMDQIPGMVRDLALTMAYERFQRK